MRDHELANVCRTKIGRDPDQLDALLRGLELLNRVAIEIVAVDHPKAVPLA